MPKKPYNFTDDTDMPSMACEPALAYKTTNRDTKIANLSTSDKRNSDLSYSFLQAEKKRQKQMIAIGKMEKPKLKDDVFTLEQETDFSRKITIDDIFQNR